jgi:hypothetical protein
MKKAIPYITFVAICLFLQGCLKDKLTKTYQIRVPVYKEKSEVYANIKSNEPRSIQSPGKIFIYGNYIFLNEVDKGVHIIDNSNPSSPIVKSFIDIPGNLDIAVKGNTLYADLYTDLVVIDIADPLDAAFVKYLPDIFPERNYGNGFVADSTKIIVDWKVKDTTVNLNHPCYACEYVTLSVGAQSGTAGANPVGIAGSMARFSLVGDYLYTVNSRELSTIDISYPTNPQKVGSQNVGWQIETIYPFSNKLFIGSQQGMFVYDISSPASPVRQSQFMHARACDPVIADGNFAYVTLRGGTPCEGFNNQLDVINISNILSPTLLKTYPMVNPHGLALDNNWLFICDGAAGLKLYDATDPLNLLLKKQIDNIVTYDVIAFNGNLVVVAKEGLYQYDYSAPGNLVLRSKISVNR